MKIFLKRIRLSGMPYPEVELKNEALAGKLRDRLGREKSGEKEGLASSGAAIWLTDDAGEAKRLTKAGECVVYLLTGKNRECFCDGILWCVETPEEESADGKNQEEVCWRQELAALEQEGFPDWLPESFLWRIWLRCNDLPWHICETDRLMLREMMEEDLDFILEMQREEQGFGSAQPCKDEEKQKESTAGVQAEGPQILTAQMRALELEKLAAYRKQMYGFYGFGIWLVLEKESGIPVGRAGLQMRDSVPGPELGFSIAPAWRQRGYAGEACRAVLAQAWEELEVDQVYAVVDQENVKSVRLCKNLGFMPEHEENMDGRICIVFVKKENDGNPS